MPAKNVNLRTAQQTRNDKFFTLLADIEAELRFYQTHFRDKTIYCNCDDPACSQFWQYFKSHFSEFGLKELVATCHAPSEPACATVWAAGGLRIWPLKSGDFRSPDCTEIMQMADIIVTNPPFSLWREYVAQLIAHQKKFIIVGPMNAITYKNVFPLLRDNKIWLGNTQIKAFLTPDQSIRRFGNVFWYTNLDHSMRHEPLALTCGYDPALFPVYENYNAIEVSRVAGIPCDYDGAMGVPVSFLTRYCPDQFEILGLSSMVATHLPSELPKHLRGGMRFYLKDPDGQYRRLYERLVIKRK